MKEVEVQSRWICAKCGEPLVEAKVRVHYLGNAFSMEMLNCPKCGMAMVTEEMAVKKMAEAEKILEDK
ncbi:MAG: DVU_1557 family redox protein [Syntrophorhabdales bacterium]|jgi:RNase P subunit RPR2